MCSKRVICGKCNWEKITEWGDIKLCQCDLAEVERSISKVKVNKIHSDSWLSYHFNIPDEKLVKAILKDFEKLLKNG